MPRFYPILTLLVLSLNAAWAVPTEVADPCATETEWRKALCAFAETNLKHTAWGYEHSKRDYLLASDLARDERIDIDDDVLFAAAMLHDVGGFAPYAIEKVDHALRSTQVSDELLKPTGFPMSKSEAVKKAILTHSYYATDKPETAEARVLHDADTLDFLGHIGAVRIFSIVGKEDGFPTMASAFALLEKFRGSLANKVYGGTATQRRARERTAELGTLLATLKTQSYGLNAL